MRCCAAVVIVTSAIGAGAAARTSNGRVGASCPELDDREKVVDDPSVDDAPATENIWAPMLSRMDAIVFAVPYLFFEMRGGNLVRGNPYFVDNRDALSPDIYG